MHFIKTEENICGFLQMQKTLGYDDLATSKMVMQMCHIVILHVHCLSCLTVVTLILFDATLPLRLKRLQAMTILLSNTVVFEPKFMNTLCHHAA